MKRIWQFLFWGLWCFLFSNPSLCQNHVEWICHFDSESQRVIISGKIDSTWHIYSPKTNPDLGPIPLSISFAADKGIKRKGNLQFLTEPTSYMDENFGGIVYIWETGLDIQQVIKVKRPGKIKITLNYMACDETRCLPPIDKVIELTITK